MTYFHARDEHHILFSYTHLFNLILLFAFYGLVVRVMVFNATFNNTSVAFSFIGGAGKQEKPTDVS